MPERGPWGGGAHNLLILLMGTTDCHKIGKVFSVPRILEAGYISLPGLHQLGTDDACVG